MLITYAISTYSKTGINDLGYEHVEISILQLDDSKLELFKENKRTMYITNA